MMYLIKNPCTDPAFNLALEEYFLTRSDDEFFCFWRNRKTVVIGKNQDASTEVDFDFLASHDISLVRRNTGGGAVFHDLGNVNFSYITPSATSDFSNFAKFSRPVLSALSSLGIHAEANGRNDLTIDGAKISGNAQHMTHGRLLHHGTLLFSSDFSYMQGALKVDPRKLKTKGVSSVRSRVTNISSHLPAPMPIEDFIAHLEQHILTYFPNIRIYTPTQDDLIKIEKLAAEKYRCDDWTLRRFGNYEFKNSIRLPCGILNVSFEARDGVINGLSISGDFFGIRDITELCSLLVGVKHEEQEMRKLIGGIGLSQYISGCTTDEFMSLFF